MGVEVAEAKEIIFRSQLADIPIPNHLPVHTYCFQNFPDYHSRPAFVDVATSQVVTYAQLELTSRRVAVGLQNLGIRKNDGVMILLQNSPEFLFTFLATSFAGAISVPTNPLLTAEDIAKLAKISNPKLIVTHSFYLEKVKGISDAKIVTIEPPLSPGVIDFSSLIKSDERQFDEVKIDPEDTSTLLFSSGTTGLPKGVMLSHKNIVTSVSQQVDGENPNHDIRVEDKTLCLLPMCHVFGLTAITLCNLRAGATLVIMPRFGLKQLLDVIQQYRVTFAPLVPPVLLHIVNSPATSQYDLSSIRRIMIGAAPVSDQLIASFQAKLPNATIGQGYGMTECGAIALSSGFAKRPTKFKSGSCGAILRNYLLKIVEPSTGASLPQNQLGEICVKSDSVMKGYLNDEETTKRTIDSEGWLHTGDLGYVDDDDELFIIDRLKELIKVKGFQVAPAELEALLVTHPEIVDAAVFPMKDELSGEVPIAYVVRANGSTVSEFDIKQYISSKVASYKRIHRVVFTNEIPKSAAGKTLRKTLMSRL